MTGREQDVDGRPTVEEVVGSFTGFDELAIEKAFRADFGQLNSTMTTRALVFVLERRNGKDDKSAYGEAMRATLKECNERFAPKRQAQDDEDQQGNV